MMNHDWSTADIVEDFTLLPSEITFLGSNDPHNHLGKALLLKFFQKESRFPEDLDEIPPEAIEYVAQQLDLPSPLSTPAIGTAAVLKIIDATSATCWDFVLQPWLTSMNCERG